MPPASTIVVRLARLLCVLSLASCGDRAAETPVVEPASEVANVATHEVASEVANEVETSDADAESSDDATGVVVPPAPPRIVVPGSRVSFGGLEGFTPIPRFPGIRSDDDSASIHLMTVPVDVVTMLSGMTNERMAQSGMEVVAREPIELLGQATELIEVRMTADGTTVGKWILHVSDGASTHGVTATWLIEDEATWRAPLRAALLGIELESEVRALALDFDLGTSAKLVIDPRGTAGSLMFAAADPELAEGPDRPFLVAGPSIKPVPIRDRVRFAVGRVRNMPGVSRLEAEPVERTLDGLAAVDIAGTFTDRDTGEVRHVLACVVFEPSDMYTVIAGFAGPEHADEYLPEFRAVIDGYRRIASH
jgi:hypothetical protein